MGTNSVQNHGQNQNGTNRIDKLYDKCQMVNMYAIVAFFLVVFLAIIRAIRPQFYPAVIDTIQILTIVFNVGATVYVDNYLLYNAESELRKSAIHDGFGVELTDSLKEYYYNNSCDPSEYKYYANVFESNYFTKNISKEMIPFALGRSFFALVVLGLVIWIVQNPDLKLVVADTVFSSLFIMKTVSLCVYVYRMHELYNVPFRIFITENISEESITNAQRAMLMNYAVEYEAIKAHYKVLLSKRIYSKNQSKLTAEWAEIEKKIHIKKKQQEHTGL